MQVAFGMERVMEIKLVFQNVMYGYIESEPEFEEKRFEVDEETKIGQLFTVGDLSEYYPLSGVYSLSSSSLPYVINSHNEVTWDVLYENARVVDFIRTHNIVDCTINVKIGYVQAGGPGFKELLEVWQLLYPIIDTFNTVAGSAVIVGSAGKWLHSLFNNCKSRHAPHSQIDLLFSRERWSSAELSQRLEIDNEDAKNLLRLFRYEFDKHSMQYVQQPVSLELREKLLRVEVRATGMDYK